MDPDAFEHFVRERMSVADAPGVPEVRLWRAEPRTGLNAFLERHGKADIQPYWAFAWGGGRALARFVIDNPGVVEGRRVLDLGCGSGLVGIAALKAGAGSVLATDIDGLALSMTRLNAVLNSVEIETRLANLLDVGAPTDIEVVLMGDVFYETELAEQALAFARACVAQGRTVLIGDPGRATLPTDALRRIDAAGAGDFGGRARAPGDGTGGVFTPG